MLALSVLLFDLLRPGILQRDRAVEDEVAGSRIGIEREVGESLELVTLGRQSIAERRLAFRLHDLERIRIQVGFEIAVCVRLSDSEEPIVKADLCVDRMRRAHPVDCPFYLATGSCAARLALQIGGATQL